MGPINVADHPEVPVFRYPRGRALAALTLALGLVTAPAHAQDYPRLGLHVQLYQNGFPMITGNDVGGPFDTSVLDAIARYDEVTFGASPASEYRPDLVAQLRTRHPGIHVIGYVMAENIYLGPNTPDSLVNLPTRIRRLVRDDGAWLYNRSGGIYSFVNINFAKRDGSGRYTVAEDLANLFADVVGTTGVWDGMFFDYFCDGVLWSQTPAESIDVVRAGYTTQTAFDAAWLAGSQAFANRMRTRVGPNFVLIGNCGLGTKYSTMNGWMRENFPNQNGGTWYANMLPSPGGYLTDETHFRQPTHGYLFTAWQSPQDPYSVTNTRKVRYGLGSAALGNGYGIFAPSNLDVTTYPYEYWWYDEYAVDLVSGRADSSLAHAGWLGQALGNAYQMVWPGTGPDAVSNPGFETDVTSGWNFGAFVPATIARDTSNAAVGSACARITVPAAGVHTYDVTLASQGTLPLSAGGLYSATFWARALPPRDLPVVAGIQGAGQVAQGTVSLDSTWRQFQVALIPGTSQAAQLEFYLAGSAGQVWLDDVHLQAGASSVWRRDFQNGIVLVNPAGTPMTAPLGRPFRRILGMRDPATNDGSTVTQAAVPPGDALFLIGSDATPPAPVTDLHPTPN
jgi:Hypothetical glycosyl hydrolase family 15/Carbohydrate binding domain